MQISRYVMARRYSFLFKLQTSDPAGVTGHAYPEHAKAEISAPSAVPIATIDDELRAQRQVLVCLLCTVSNMPGSISVTPR